MEASRWYLVRHGETAWNRESRFQGQADPPLNDAGRTQARAVAKRLAGVSFAAAYASDLGRVTQTAAAVARGRELRVTELAELREKGFGEWEGLTYREAEARDPEHYRRIFRAPTYDEDTAPPGGESDLQMLGRVSGVARRLRDEHGGRDENVLIVGHGGSLCALIVSLLGLPSRAIWRFRIANCGLAQVTVFDDGAATLDLFNDTGHLRSCAAH
ncbi:MAG: histidine phosphatase family protein [Spirochaetaceae bacterium]|nr:histidine phosphatase family protein [Spirochaetaceae bacterium]